MVDYDTAAAVVQDSNADPVMLAKIAYENPEFGANVAANSRAYPGLKRWIAEFGDQRARDFLAGMGITAQGDPVRPREQAGSDGPDSAVNDTPASDVPPANDPSSDAGTDRHLPGNDYDDRNSDSLAEELINVSDELPSSDPYGRPLPFQLPVATNPYGFTAELALTTADQTQIAQIAQYAPELRACIAYNPNTYPALIDWLAQLHDPQVDAALAARQR